MTYKSYHLTYWCIVSIFLLVGCNPRTVSVAPKPDAALQEMTDAAVSGAMIRPPLIMRWKTKLKGPLLSRPAVRGTTLFIPMSNNKIYLMDARNGNVDELTNDLNGTGAVTPAMRGDQLFLSVVGQSNREWREFLAYDVRQEKILWRRPFRNAWSAPYLVDGVLYTGAENGTAYALDADSGEIIWQFKAEQQIRTAPVVVDGVVFIGSNDNHIYALDAATGEARWSYQTDGSIPVAPAVANDAVYAVSYDQNLYCLNRTNGRLRWKFSASGSLYSTPAIQNGRVFLGSNDGNLYCLDAATGEELWHFETSGIVVASPVPMGPVVYAASTDRRLYAIDTTTGQALWQYETGGSITVTPFVVNNLLIIGSEDRYVYAFGESPQP